MQELLAVQSLEPELHVLCMQLHNVISGDQCNSLLSSVLGDANRQISEYKFKLSKAEQDITTLEQSVSISVKRQMVQMPLNATKCLSLLGQSGQTFECLWVALVAWSLQKLCITVAVIQLCFCSKDRGLGHQDGTAEFDPQDPHGSGQPFPTCCFLIFSLLGFLLLC